LEEAAAAAAVVEPVVLSVGTVTTSLSSSVRLRLVTLGIILDKKCPTFMVDGTWFGVDFLRRNSILKLRVPPLRSDIVEDDLTSYWLVLPTLRGHSPFLNE
jgi:hypothetical protein